MTSAKEHYDNLLAKHYSWAFGDYDVRVRENIDFFTQHHITPRLSKRAVDLGCGTGFQAMALADLGFNVLGVDLCETLLRELENHILKRKIDTVCDDILNFQDHCSKDGIELATCMGDVMTHLESFDKVATLFMKVYKSLEPGGRFVITFRDLTHTLKGLDRIIPFQSDEQKIMTTFLEYQGDYVNVHDIIYIRTESGWRLKKGVYKKLRVGKDQALNIINDAGFKIDYCGNESGFVRIIACK